MLKWLLSSMMASGLGDRFDGNTGGDLASLTAALGDEKKKKGDQPLSRLQDAFSQLKAMHKDDKPFDFETAQWPYGPVGAPSQAMASAPTPMPMARPPQAPMSPQEGENIYDSFENSPAGKRMRAADIPAPASSPISDFFARNTAMMKDPTTGQMIDPSAAAKFGGSPILNGLFG